MRILYSRSSGTACKPTSKNICSQKTGSISATQNSYFICLHLILTHIYFAEQKNYCVQKML